MSQGEDAANRADGASSRSRERDVSSVSGGEDAIEVGDVKERPRENSEMKGKVIRVLTVLAYVFSVSLAAIMLSMYYMFLWDPKMPSGMTRRQIDDRADEYAIQTMEGEALRHRMMETGASQAHPLRALDLDAPALQPALQPAPTPRSDAADEAPSPTHASPPLETSSAHADVVQTASLPAYTLHSHSLEAASTRTDVLRVLSIQESTLPDHDVGAGATDAKALETGVDQVPTENTDSVEKISQMAPGLLVHILKTQAAQGVDKDGDVVKAEVDREDALQGIQLAVPNERLQGDVRQGGAPLAEDSQPRKSTLLAPGANETGSGSDITTAGMSIGSVA